MLRIDVTCVICNLSFSMFSMHATYLCVFFLDNDGNCGSYICRMDPACGNCGYPLPVCMNKKFVIMLPENCEIRTVHFLNYICAI